MTELVGKYSCFVGVLCFVVVEVRRVGNKWGHFGTFEETMLERRRAERRVGKNDDSKRTAPSLLFRNRCGEGAEFR